MTRTPERGPQCRVLPGKSSRTKLLARSQPAPSPPDLSLSIQMPWYLQVKVLGPKALGTGWSPPCSCCCRGPGQRLLFWGPPSPFLVRCWFLSSPCTAHAAQVPCHMHTRTHIHTHIHGTDAHRHTCTNTQHRCAKCIHARTHMHTHAQHRCTQHTQTCIHIHTAMHTCVCAQRHREPGPPPRGARHARPGQQRALLRLQCWPVRPQQPRWGAGDFLLVGQKASGEKA